MKIIIARDSFKGTLSSTQVHHIISDTTKNIAPAIQLISKPIADGGVGAATASGWQFLDEQGEAILLGGAGLARISQITKPKDIGLPPIEVLCDVDKPLCGDGGAARVYGLQKGARLDMVEQLERNLNHLSLMVKSQLGKDIKDIPGAGAAGGLAAGAIASWDAKLVSGIKTIIKESGLEQEMEHANRVITGEGSFDHQSLMGKVISGIAKIAQETSTKVAVIAGQTWVSDEECKKHGIAYVVLCKKEGMSLDEAIDNCEKLLSDTKVESAEKIL